jgi:cytochrome c-type biogenesis protein CcmH/NrfG
VYHPGPKAICALGPVNHVMVNPCGGPRRAAQHLDQGRVDDAIPLLEQAARFAPNHEALHIRLARAYLEKGRAEDAFRALSLVRRLYPDNWFAPLGTAVLFAATERPEQAKPLLDEALRLGGDVARTTAAGTFASTNTDFPNAKSLFPV